MKFTFVNIAFRVFLHAADAIRLACLNCPDNCQYMLLGNKLSTLVDLLALYLKVGNYKCLKKGHNHIHF